MSKEVAHRTTAERIAVLATGLAGAIFTVGGVAGAITDAAGSGVLVATIAIPWGLAMLLMAYLRWRRVEGAGCFTIGLTLPAAFVAGFPLSSDVSPAWPLLIALMLVFAAGLVVPIVLFIHWLNSRARD
jgi:hypothetical protein